MNDQDFFQLIACLEIENLKAKLSDIITSLCPEEKLSKFTMFFMC